MSSDSEIQKLVANALQESTKRSTKYAVIVFEGEQSYEYTYRLSPTAVSTKVVPQKCKSVRDNADWYYG